MKELSVTKELEIRFSEVDMMRVVWHGAYPLYLEDAREAFGEKYGLSYHLYIRENTYAPLVEMKMNYKKPLMYGMKPSIRITYRPCDAAKIVFDYEIFNPENGDVYLTARSTQVFMDRNYQLLWFCPDFYTEWKKTVGLE